MEIRKNIIIRFGIIYFAIMLFGAVIIGGVLKIQNINTDDLQKIAKKIKDNTQEIPAKRGNICADDGSVLATSVPEYEIRMDFKAPRVRKIFEEKSGQFITEVAGFCGIPKWKFRSDVKKAFNKGNRWFKIGDKALDYTELQKLKQLPSLKKSLFGSGLIIVTENKRILPHGELASRTIGVLNKGQHEGVHGAIGYTGIEGMQESYLAGEEGKAIKRNFSGRWINVPIAEPEDGKDVITTLNVNLQDFAQNALMRQMQKSLAEWGTAVVMEVKTGDVKAIANIGRRKDGTYGEIYNYALGNMGCSEPGSTFKLMSLMVAMDHGYVDTCDVFDTGNGIWEVYGEKIKDSDWYKGGHGKISMKRIFELSSNVGTAKIISEIYTGKEEEFIDRIYKFGLNKPLGLGFLGEGKPYIKYPTDQSWSGLSLPWISHGYEIKMTPLQTLTFYNAVANDGKMVKPRFVTEVQENGITYRKFKTEVINPSICSRQTISKAQDMLKAVCENGTGRSLRSPYYTLAGKTGTATIAYGAEGYLKDGKKNYQASFAGYFPADDPKYSCMVVIVGPKGSYYGASVAGPVFKEVADKVYATFLDPQEIEENTNPVVPEIKPGFNEDISVAAAELDLEVNSTSSELIKVVASENKLQVSDINISQGTVPNVKGMGASDALFILEDAGLKVHMNGIGKVTKQSLKAGQKFRTGQSIWIQLG